MGLFLCLKKYLKKNVENCCIESKEYIIFTSSNNNKTKEIMREPEQKFSVKEMKNVYKAENGKTLKKILWGVEIPKPDYLLFDGWHFNWVIDGKPTMFLSKDCAEKFKK